MHNTRKTLFSLLGASVLALAACGGSVPTSLPSLNVPTLPPVASGTSACVDAPTMTVIDQIRAAGADAPTLLEANDDALIAGLGALESTDATVTAWRDALVEALEAGDFDAAADEIAKLADGEVTIASC